MSGPEAAEALTSATDLWIRDLWSIAGADLDFEAELVALGGYGRRELALGSDVDLVIEIPASGTADPELHDAVGRFVAWCREPRVKVSHAVRSEEQLREAVVEDVRTAVSYLDARPLGPNWNGSSREIARVELEGADAGVGFVKLLWEGYKQRLNRFGKTVYRLEPELKNGAGGLRDLHAVAWAAQVRFDCAPHDEICEHAGWSAKHRDTFRQVREWLLDIRHSMHARNGRKSDRLRFGDQSALAQARYPELDPRDAAERLMREHYSHARSASKLTERFLRRWDVPTAQPKELAGTAFFTVGEVMGTSRDASNMEPREVAEALRVASEHELLLDPKLEDELEQAVANWQVGEAEIGELVGDLLTDLETSERTAQRLLDLGLLTAVVPEFEPIVCHVQHDVYHVYTTDTHSLLCHQMARGLLNETFEPKWPEFGEIARRIEQRDAFLLAVLFHDIGKNRGGGHSRKGAVMMYNVGPRLGLDGDEVSQLSYLVREHLALSHAARRHDINDPRIIRDLAARIRTSETLNQLTALTFCDMSNVGDDVMNDWNASLLLSLHRRLHVAIEHGIESVWQRVSEELKQHQDAAVRLFAERNDMDEGQAKSSLDEFFRDVPAGHVVETPVEALVRQYQVYAAAKVDRAPSVLSTPLEVRGVTEIIVSAPDVPGALAQITGTISAMGLNILTAQIVTTADKTTLDIFRVAQSGGAAHALNPGGQRAVTDENRIARLEARLLEVLQGELSVEELLESRIREKRLADRETPPVETAVRVVPELSDDFTVIEVKAPDRIGLLYEIASTLQANEVNIHLSKIDSLGTQVIDTFFVDSTSGSPLDEEHCERVLTALTEALASSRFDG